MSIGFTRSMRALLAGLLMVGGALVAVVGNAPPASAASTGSVVRTIDVGRAPYAVSSDGTHIWVANFYSDLVTELSAADGSVVHTIPLGWMPESLSSDGTHVWIANPGGDSVTELNASDGSAVQAIGVGSTPIGVSSDGTHVWVTNSNDGTVTELSAADGSVVRTIDVGQNSPFDISSDGTHVWVVNIGGNSVTELNASDGSVIQTIGVGSFPRGVSSDGTHVWVANTNDGTVTELSASTGSIVRTIRVGSSPLYVSSDGTHVWVTNTNDGTVTELSAADGSVVQTIGVGRGPVGVSSDGTHVWVANYDDYTVSEIDSGSPPPPVKGTLVALGDSIAAGEGQGPAGGYPDNRNAYPAILAGNLGGWTSYNLAKSGACAGIPTGSGVPATVTAHCKGNPKSTPNTIIDRQLPQLKILNIHPNLITLTVGADDIYFSQCFAGLLAQSLDPSINPCTGPTLSADLSSFAGNLVQVMRYLTSNYPNARIAITDYFNPLPDTTTATGSLCSGSFVSAAYLVNLVHQHLWATLASDLLDPAAGLIHSRTYLQSLYSTAQGVVDGLDQTIHQIASQYGATVSVPLDFTGHDACTDYGSQGQAWVFGPQIVVNLLYTSNLLSKGFNASFFPADRCTPVQSNSHGCDGTPFVKPIDRRVRLGPLSAGHLVGNIDLRENDVPHLTISGAQHVAATIRSRLGW